MSFPALFYIKSSVWDSISVSAKLKVYDQFCYVILMWKFVSEAYLSNLSLDEDQMPYDLQPGLEKDII